MFSSNWRQKAADGGDRTFRDQFTKREPASAFGGGSREGGREFKPAPVWGRKEGGNPFGKEGTSFAPRERVEPSVQQTASKPRVNPFGNAVPKDVDAIQREILQKKQSVQEPAKKIELETVKTEITAIKREQDKKVADNVPAGAGSWRSRAADAKKKESVFSKPKQSEKPKPTTNTETVVKKTTNATKPADKTSTENKKASAPAASNKKAATENVYELLDNVRKS